MTDEHTSPLGHGPPHHHTIPTRRYRVPESLLRQHLGIQPQHVLHQIFHPASIPANIPSTPIPSGLLDDDRDRGCVYVLDVL